MTPQSHTSRRPRERSGMTELSKLVERHIGALIIRIGLRGILQKTMFITRNQNSIGNYLGPYSTAPQKH